MSPLNNKSVEHSGEQVKLKKKKKKKKEAGKKDKLSYCA